MSNDAETKSASRFPARLFGIVGLVLSVAGVAGLVSGPWLSTVLGQDSQLLHLSVVLSLSACAVGLAAGFIGMFFPPRRMATWAMLIGFYGSMHIPTFVTMYRLQMQ